MVAAIFSTIICTFVAALCGAFLHGIGTVGAVAITRARGTKLRALAQSGLSGLAKARLIASQPNRFLLACRLTMALALVFGAIGVQRCLNSGLKENLSKGGALSLISEYAHWFGYLGVLLYLLLVVAVGQVARSLAQRSPERALIYLSGPLMAMASMLRPVAWSVASFSRRVAGLAGINHEAPSERVVSAEEISELIEQGAESGDINNDEREMIAGVFDFSDTVVREVMTPRSEIIHVSEEATLQEVRERLERDTVSRLVVIGEDLDDVRGVLYAKDLLPFVGTGDAGFDLTILMREPYRVVNTTPTVKLLQDFRRNSVHFAIVIDEHGGTDGVVTIEDLLEEIVGEIYDEYDSPTEEPGVTAIDEGQLLVDGGLAVEDLAERHGIELDRGPYDTVAGYVLHQIGRLPGVGETVAQAPYQLSVEEVENNRIRRVKIVDLRKFQ